MVAGGEEGGEAELDGNGGGGGAEAAAQEVFEFLEMGGVAPFDLEHAAEAVECDEFVDEVDD